jgi:adenylylsulfate kinase
VETHTRSIAKAVSYRLLGSMVTGGIVYFFSGDVRVSAGVGAIDVVAKIGLYFLHERMWNYINFGRQRPPEYEI